MAFRDCFFSHPETARARFATSHVTCINLQFLVCKEIVTETFGVGYVALKS